MRNKQILFVTYHNDWHKDGHNDGFNEGFSYALDLAKTLKSGISVLMVYKRKAMEKFEDAMTVVTFAEEGDFKTAMELIRGDLKDKYEKCMNALKKKCEEAEVKMEINAAVNDICSAVKNILRQNDSVELILLSPSIMSDEAVDPKELERLVKCVSRPVVTMSKNASAA